ncbi:MAG: NTP transferase domain-containing protein [Bacteroidetes bacterium]|nr:NTP transferase domain-containing protein [Bacteroidota bacterium]
MKTSAKDNTSVIILCGGNSERMNFPKCFLSVGNKTLVEQIAEKYCHAQIDKPIIVLNSKFNTSKYAEILDRLSKYTVKVVNTKPQNGRVFSIKLGLKKLKNKNFCFIHNVDNPNICTTLIDNMLKNADSNTYVSPVFNGKNGHPVLIGKKIIFEILNAEDEKQTLREILSSFKKNDVDSGSLNVLENINTLQDWESYLSKNN